MKLFSAYVAYFLWLLCSWPTICRLSLVVLHMHDIFFSVSSLACEHKMAGQPNQGRSQCVSVLLANKKCRAVESRAFTVLTTHFVDPHFLHSGRSAFTVPSPQLAHHLTSLPIAATRLSLTRPKVEAVTEGQAGGE